MPEPIKTAKPAAAPSTLDIGDIYYILFRNLRTILICSLLGLLASGVVFWMTPTRYESEARLLVRNIPEATVFDRLVTGGQANMPIRANENVVNSEMMVLSSRELIEKVMASMGVEQFSDEPTNRINRAQVAEKVQQALRIESPKNSNVIRVNFYGATPTMAQSFLRQLIEVYLQKHAELGRSSEAYDFLTQQTDQARQRMNEIEEELRKLKQGEGILALEETQKSYAQRHAELQRGVDEIETALAAVQAREEALRPMALAAASTSQTVSAWASAAASDDVVAIKARLQRLQQREAEMLSSFTTNSIPLQRLREQIEETQSLFDSTLARNAASNLVSSSANTNFPPMLVEVRALSSELQARLTMQKQVLARVQDEIRRVNAVEARIVQLTRNREVMDASYRFFYESLEQARVKEALNSSRFSNVTVFEPATLPSRKIKVKLPKNMALALFCGVGLGLGLALLREYVLDNTIRRVSELTGIFHPPLVMSLELLPTGGLPPVRTPGAAETATVVAPELEEAFDMLRSRLLSVLGTTQTPCPCLVGIASCVVGAGVSTLAGGLAQALARDLGEGVVLVDASAETGAPVCYDVTADSRVERSLPTLQGRTAGASRTQALLTLLQELRAGQARYVIVDLPPVTETGLTLRVVGATDGLLVVIPSEKVTKNVISLVHRWLVQSGVKILGCVLNKRRKYVPAWLCQKL